MFGSSSSSEKSSAIHQNVKETISHTYGDLIASVNEALYDRFPELFMKAPVVIVHNQIPSDILDWYKTYVFGQANQNGQQPLTNKLTKTLESPIIKPLTNAPPLESPAESPISKPTISSDEREDVPKIQDDESILMDFEVAKEAIQDSGNLEIDGETIQFVSQFTEDSSIQIFSNDNFVVEEDDDVEKDEPKDGPKDGSKDDTVDEPKDDLKDDPRDGSKDEPKDEDKSENFTKSPKPTQENHIENVSLQEIIAEENNQMDIEVDNQPAVELSKLELAQPVDQPLKETFRPKVEDNLQLSEESSNESTNLETKGVNTEMLRDLISTVMDTIKNDSKAMEIEDQPNQLKDESSQLESNQSMSTQSVEEQSKLGISEQFDIQLSEESSNGSISMEDEKEEDVKKDDTVNDDKVQNIKNNNNYNVLAAIEDENNLLDFEDN